MTALKSSAAMQKTDWFFLEKGCFDESMDFPQTLC